MPTTKCMLVLMLLLAFPADLSGEPSSRESEFIFLNGDEITVHEKEVSAVEYALHVEQVKTADPSPSRTADEREVDAVILFKPLLADPEWPHISLAYSNIDDHIKLKHAGIVSFGELIPLFTFGGTDAGRFQIGLDGAIISLFDVDAPSRDLVNTDFQVGLPFIYRKGGFSVLSRFFHQSSHLGDEFLMRDRVDRRVNVSYEGLASLVSFEFDQGLPGLRLYGGPGYLLRRNPDELTPWILQAGVEYRSPAVILDNWLRPLAAVDVQFGREDEFRARYSGRIGFQLERWAFLHRRLQVFFETYKGSLPHGQLYEYQVQGIGVGLHLFYD